MAVIHQGELRGVGAIADLTAQVQGKVEIIFASHVVPAGLKNLAAETRISGDVVIASLSEEHQDAALEILRREKIRLISLTPLRRSLEEYYVQSVQPRVGKMGVGA